MTLDRAVLDIGISDQSRGLTFVAVSRVRRLNDITFRPGFTWQRLQAIAGKVSKNGEEGRSLAEKDAERRDLLPFVD